MQSGQSSLEAYPPDYTTQCTQLANAINCSNTTVPDRLACMRAIPATVLEDAVEHLALTFAPVIDNVTYSGNVAETNRLAGNIARVPVLMGLKRR